MTTAAAYCAQCDQPNSDPAGRFCWSCGTALEQVATSSLGLAQPLEPSSPGGHLSNEIFDAQDRVFAEPGNAGFGAPGSPHAVAPSSRNHAAPPTVDATAARCHRSRLRRSGDAGAAYALTPSRSVHRTAAALTTPPALPARPQRQCRPPKRPLPYARRDLLNAEFGLPKLRDRVSELLASAEIETRHEREFTLHSTATLEVRATTNASAGYCYVAAWRRDEAS